MEVGHVFDSTVSLGTGAFSSKKIRRYLRCQGIGVVIAPQTQERRVQFKKAASRTRNAVERLINRLKQFRRIATRYEKRAMNSLAMLSIAAIMHWL